MRAVVVYESMYGNTRALAEAIGEGLGAAYDVVVTPVSGAAPGTLEGAALLVVGGPTHAHGMSWPTTRRSAAESADRPSSGLALETDAPGQGVREWLASLGPLSMDGAAFDTRMHGPVAFTGQASRGISKALRRHGLEEIADPASFLVTKQNHLEPGELERARGLGGPACGRSLAAVDEPYDDGNIFNRSTSHATESSLAMASSQPASIRRTSSSSATFLRMRTPRSSGSTSRTMKSPNGSYQTGGRSSCMT